MLLLALIITDCGENTPVAAYKVQILQIIQYLYIAMTSDDSRFKSSTMSAVQINFTYNILP